MVADFSHDLIAATQEPVEDLGGPKAPIQAEHNLDPTFTAPPQMGFDLQEGGFQGRHGGRFPPEQRLVEDLPILACRDPEGFPARFTAVTPQPGALTPLGLGSNRHRGEIDIHPQARVVEAVAGCRAIAFEIVPGHLLQLPHVLRGTGPQGPRDRGLLGTATPPKGALHGTIGTDRHIILGDGLGPTEDPAQGIEQFVDRTVADGFLPDLHLFSHGGKETLPPQILAYGTQTGTPRGHRRMLAHGALLSAQGHFLLLTLYEGIYPLQECTLAHF